MFYPVDSLRRGGRFYLCWLADSWPERFAAVSQRQLWSHDIRKLCDDLLKVMTNESGRPVNRFSLRLSSQLMRGLVRLYQRKVSLYLVDLCMTNASVLRQTNKKWHTVDEGVVERLHLVEAQPALVLEVPEETVNDRQVAQLIENSGNIVANEQDITLKEFVIPDIQLPNDGFGEENPEQALRLALDWPVEAMLGVDAPAQYGSAAGAALEVSDLDASRRPGDARMESAAELNITMFNKSTGPKISAGPDFAKDVPEIPEIPIPDLSVPVPQAENEPPEKIVETELPTLVEEQPQPQIPDTPAEIELQELEEIPAKRRRKHKLIVDKATKIESKVLTARINNPKVELRCEDATDDVLTLTIPVPHYFRRMAHAGYKYKDNISNELNRLFLRNLGALPNQVAEEREMEILRAQLSHRRHLEIIEEETSIREKTPVPQPVEQQVELQIDQPVDMRITKDATHVVEPMEIDRPIQAVVLDLPTMEPENMQVDISDLPTQKLESLSQAKRSTDAEASPSKRLRRSDYKTFSLSQQRAKEPEIDITEAEKENIPMNQQSPIKSPTKSQRNVLSMLEQAGIADIEPEPTQTIESSRRELEPSRTEKRDSEGTETPLGSLDRTKVSLGDSDKTTDSVRHIRTQWGTVRTMTRIVEAVRGAGPLTVWSLTASAPRQHRNLAAARCFNSILKLKQHGFIIVRKDPDTLEITNIILGPRFD